MLEEIREQPVALERALQSELPRIAPLKARLERTRPKLIVLAARGTSDNAAQFGRYLLEITTGIPVSLAAPSIYTLYEANLDLRDTLAIAISQSGESTDINMVQERARAQGAITIGITNEEASTLARISEYPLLVRAGHERSVAATKTYTGQLLSFYLIAYALGADLRLDDVKRLPDWTAQALNIESEIAADAERYRFMERATVVGRGLNYSNAFEFSLKLMETCYVVAERFSAADFLHGPIAMVERSFPLFLFAPPGVTWPTMKEMIERLQQLRAETLVITGQENPDAAGVGGRTITLPVNLDVAGARPRELYTPIPYIVPAQLFAAYLAVNKGLNPDEPRTLSKVTQTL
jgi:glucosamine--fructose-6-phosphate aminotransferase (isomerizing)